VIRGLSAGLMSSLSGAMFFPVLLVRLDWPSGEVFFHTSRGTISFDGYSWTGVGSLASFAAPGETFGLGVTNATIRLIGAFNAVMDHKDQAVKNRAGTIYFGATSERNGATLTGAPFAIFAGNMDATKVVVNDDGPNVNYALELTLGSGTGARANASFSHTAEDQASKFPGDTSGRHVQFAGPNARNSPWPNT